MLDQRAAACSFRLPETVIPFRSVWATFRPTICSEIHDVEPRSMQRKRQTSPTMFTSPSMMGNICYELCRPCGLDVTVDIPRERNNHLVASSLTKPRKFRYSVYPPPLVMRMLIGSSQRGLCCRTAHEHIIASLGRDLISKLRLSIRSAPCSSLLVDCSRVSPHLYPAQRPRLSHQSTSASCRSIRRGSNHQDAPGSGTIAV